MFILNVIKVLVCLVAFTMYSSIIIYLWLTKLYAHDVPSLAG